MLNAHSEKKKQCSRCWHLFPPSIAEASLLSRTAQINPILLAPSFSLLQPTLQFTVVKTRPMFKQKRICNPDCESRLAILVLSLQQIAVDKQTLCPEDLCNILYFFTLPDFTCAASYISDSRPLKTKVVCALSESSVLLVDLVSSWEFFPTANTDEIIDNLLCSFLLAILQ